MVGWRIAAILVVSIDMLCGCGGERSAVPPPTTTPATTTPRVTSDAHNDAEWYRPPSQFEGVDPCTMVTKAEAEGMAGQTGLSAIRNAALQPHMERTGRTDTCTWSAPGTVPLAVVFQLLDQPARLDADTNQVSRWLSDNLHRPVTASYGTTPAGTGIEDCAVHVPYSNLRMVDIVLTVSAPSPAPSPTDADNLCTRNQAVLRGILTRVPWQ